MKPQIGDKVTITGLPPGPYAVTAVGRQLFLAISPNGGEYGVSLSSDWCRWRSPDHPFRVGDEVHQPKTNGYAWPAVVSEAWTQGGLHYITAATADKETWTGAGVAPWAKWPPHPFQVGDLVTTWNKGYRWPATVTSVTFDEHSRPILSAASDGHTWTNRLADGWSKWEPKTTWTVRTEHRRPGPTESWLTPGGTVLHGTYDTDVDVIIRGIDDHAE